MPIRLATPSEIPVLAGVLARAFAADPMTRWPLAPADDLPARMRAMFEIVDAPFAAEGWVHVAAEGLGVMSLLPPGTDGREREIGVAIAPAIGALTPDGGARYERFWAWIDATIPPAPHWLLLLLETGAPANVSLYERFGFRVMLAADAPDGGPRIWFMVRDPGRQGAGWPRQPLGGATSAS